MSGKKWIKSLYHTKCFCYKNISFYLLEKNLRSVEKSLKHTETFLLKATVFQCYHLVSVLENL